MGRHKTVITPAQMKKAEGYALDGCQNCTIEGLMDWPADFINKRPDISKKLTKKRQERKLKILRGQNKRSSEGSDAMLIWQGKNVLDQTDKSEHNVKIQPFRLLLGAPVNADKDDQS